MKIVNGVQIVSIEINPQHWNVIQAGLQELPFKISQPVLAELQQQVLRQSQPAPSAAPARVVGIEGNDDNATVTLAEAA